jgi:hypothetical protein
MVAWIGWTRRTYEGVFQWLLARLVRSLRYTRSGEALTGDGGAGGGSEMASGGEVLSGD